MRKIFPLLILLLVFAALVIPGFYVPKIKSEGMEEFNPASAPSETASENGKISAKIFSTYPFNVKNRFFISAGLSSGVAEGDPVFWAGTLVGSVVKASENWSEVKTIFDPNWKTPVRLGKNEIDGLLQGGSMPLITLIQKDMNVEPGDDVRSASVEFPYASYIGKIDEIKEDSSDVFKQATLYIPYNLSELRSVEIIKSR